MQSHSSNERTTEVGHALISATPQAQRSSSRRTAVESALRCRLLKPQHHDRRCSHAAGHETLSRPSPQPTAAACEPSYADEYEKLPRRDIISCGHRGPSGYESRDSCARHGGSDERRGRSNGHQNRLKRCQRIESTCQRIESTESGDGIPGFSCHKVVVDTAARYSCSVQ